MTEVSAPLILRPKSKLPVFTPHEAARFLVRPGEDFDTVYKHILNLLGARQIHFDVDPSDGKRTRTMRVEDVATADVIMEAHNSKVKGFTTEISLACSHWDSGINPRIGEYLSPIGAALVGCNRGESWALRLSQFHNEETGERRIFSLLYDTDIRPIDLAGTLAPSYVEAADISMNISRLMLRFHDLINGKPDGAMAH